MEVKMTTMIDYQYLLGGVIASLLGFVIFYNSRKQTEKNGASMAKTVKTSVDVSYRPSETTGSTDVVIVGAGVAGSALAYALGKVIPSQPGSLILFSSLSLSIQYTHNLR
ncbi:squalene monooxygenase [Sarracenia purpurea var. burkii]